MKAARTPPRSLSSDRMRERSAVGDIRPFGIHPERRRREINVIRSEEEEDGLMELPCLLIFSSLSLVRVMRFPASNVKGGKIKKKILGGRRHYLLHMGESEVSGGKDMFSRRRRRWIISSFITSPFGRWPQRKLFFGLHSRAPFPLCTL